MALARFLQFSDLHLGRPFGWLPPERREERRRDQRRALQRCVAEALERGVHAILVAGDLFDQEGVDADTLVFALQVFDVPGCPPVFIAPGNHDPCSETSHYWNARLLAARGMKWPAHVHIFTTGDWSARPVPGLGGVRVWGRCTISSVSSLERPLVEGLLGAVRGDGSGFDLAVLHGSCETQRPPGQELIAPFSEAELLAGPFAYVAAGHYHVASRLTADAGAAAGVRMAYAGSLTALDARETGAHGALEVRIEYGRRLPFVEIEPVELDRRRVYDLSVNLAGVRVAEDIDRRVLRALDDAGATDQDLVTVRLAGRLPRGVRYTGAPPEVQARAFFLRLDVRALRPDYDLDVYRAGVSQTTEERFARALLERLDLEQDPGRRAVIESALYYGLDAFRLREVLPVYEELGLPAGADRGAFD